jgi:hypothetical protein
LAERSNIHALAHLFDLVNKHQLGDDARLDTVDGAKGISLKVRSVIGKYAIGSDGKISRRWNAISCHTRSSMVKALNSFANWLENFEGHWLSEWLLATESSKDFIIIKELRVFTISPTDEGVPRCTGGIRLGLRCLGNSHCDGG